MSEKDLEIYPAAALLEEIKRRCISSSCKNCELYIKKYGECGFADELTTPPKYWNIEEFEKEKVEN